ncbi:MAG: cation transporter [Aureispira sp.]|nr:cation transporter [Aureispira sp.]
MDNSKRENVKVQLLAVLVGILLLLGKFLAYYLTNSNTILTDALESIINVVAGSFGLYSLIVAALPKDENHPYGHGKIEFISAGVEGTLVTIAGLLIISKSIYNLFYPGPIQQIDIGIYITAGAGLINYLLGAMVERKGHKSNSLAMIASGKHLKSDAYSTIGLVVGLGVLYFTNYVWLDSVIAIIFGGIIGWTGYHIVKESVSGIMDEVDYKLVDHVVKILNEHRHPHWIDVHNLRIIKYGADLHVDCHITVPWYFNTVEAHAEVDRLEDLLQSQIDVPVELFIHVDPCIVESCSICQLTDCPKRQAPFEEIIEWELDNIMRNRKHQHD